MADRYTYLPLIGPVITLIWLLADELPRRCSPAWSRASIGIVLVCLGSLFTLTRHQLTYWQNTLTVFDRAVAVTPDNPSAQFGVGMGLLERGLFSQAMVRFRVALGIDP